MSTPSTLYKVAGDEIRLCIDSYLQLVAQSKGLTALLPEHLPSARERMIVMAGLGVPGAPPSAPDVCAEWQRRRAVPFDVETGITAGVYINLRTVAESFYEELGAATRGFRQFDAQFIAANPHYLPVLQHLAGVFSKAKLKELVGSVSDSSISGPASVRLANLLVERVDPSRIVKGEILQRLGSTMEGIVRDLVGRILLESIVDVALKARGLAFLREEEYQSLAGVVYDFRADFVLPDAANPRVFIEVRKSSSRHASLYAKDKMFSAINWKGKSPELLAVLVVDGEWTGETLRVMSNVFDYVIPITHVDELALVIEAYLNGDRSRLKWIINFDIKSSAEP